MNRLIISLILSLLLAFAVSSCSDELQNEAGYFDPMSIYLEELRETDFSSGQVSPEHLDTARHSTLAVNFDALTPPKLYANVHQTLIDKIHGWAAKASEASTNLQVAELMVLKLVETLDITVHDQINCDTIATLNSLSNDNKFPDLANFLTSSEGENALISCESLREEEQKIWRAFDRFNEIRTDRKAVVDDMISTQ